VRTQKTVYFGVAVSTYARSFTLTVTTDVFLTTEASAFPSQPECNNWTKVSYKQGRSPQDETETKPKHSKESEYWLNQPSTSRRYSAVLDQLKASPENISLALKYSPLIQLLEKIASSTTQLKPSQMTY
jgi:hypothetical protein